MSMNLAGIRPRMDPGSAQMCPDVLGRDFGTCIYLILAHLCLTGVPLVSRWPNMDPLLGMDWELGIDLVAGPGGPVINDDHVQPVELWRWIWDW